MNIQTTKTTLEKQTQKAPSTDISSFTQKFRVHFAGMMSFGRQTVSEGFFAGQALVEIKKRLPHGAWLDFLEAEGLNRETARKLRRLGSELDIAKIVQFASVEQAYKSLPPKTPNRNPPDPSDPSTAEVKGIEQETARYRAERAEAEVQTAKKGGCSRLTALSPDSPPAPPPDDNLKRSEARLAETWTFTTGIPERVLEVEAAAQRYQAGFGGRQTRQRDSLATLLVSQHYGCGVRQAALGIQDRG